MRLTTSLLLRMNMNNFTKEELQDIQSVYKAFCRDSDDEGWQRKLTLKMKY